MELGAAASLPLYRVADDASRNPDNQGTIRHITRNHSAGPDDGATAYNDTRNNCCVRTDRRTLPDECRHNCPVRLGLQGTLLVCCARKQLIRKNNAVTDEHITFYRNAFTNK